MKKLLLLITVLAIVSCGVDRKARRVDIEPPAKMSAEDLNAVNAADLTKKTVSITAVQNNIISY